MIKMKAGKTVLVGAVVARRYIYELLFAYKEEKKSYNTPQVVEDSFTRDKEE